MSVKSKSNIIWKISMKSFGMFFLRTLDASCRDCFISSMGTLPYDWPKLMLLECKQKPTKSSSSVVLAMAEATADTLLSRTFFNHDYFCVKSKTFCYCIQNHVSFLCRKEICCYYCGHERFQTL